MWDDDERNVHCYQPKYERETHPYTQTSVTNILKEMYEEDNKLLYKYEIACEISRNKKSCIHGNIKLRYVQEKEKEKEKEKDEESCSEEDENVNGSGDDYDVERGYEESDDDIKSPHDNTKDLRNEEKAVLNIDEIYERQVYKKFSYL